MLAILYEKDSAVNYGGASCQDMLVTMTRFCHFIIRQPAYLKKPQFAAN